MKTPKLRFFQVFDENGLNGPENLQYWDKDIKEWVSVGFVRVSYKEEEDAIKDRNRYEGW